MKLLDATFANEVQDVILDAISDAGLDAPEEAIPGLIKTIIALAETTNHASQLADEAANMLADWSVDV